MVEQFLLEGVGSGCTCCCGGEDVIMHTASTCLFGDQASGVQGEGGCSYMGVSMFACLALVV